MPGNSLRRHFMIDLGFDGTEGKNKSKILYNYAKDSIMPMDRS